MFWTNRPNPGNEAVIQSWKRGQYIVERSAVAQKSPRLIGIKIMKSILWPGRDLACPGISARLLGDSPIGRPVNVNQ